MSDEEIISGNWREELKQKLKNEIERHYQWAIEKAVEQRDECLALLDNVASKIIDVLPKPVHISVEHDHIWIMADTKKDFWIPHAISKGLHVTFQKSHEENEDHVDYDTKIDGTPLKVWNIIPKSCRIVEVKKHRTETAYRLICDQTEIKTA